MKKTLLLFVVTSILLSCNDIKRLVGFSDNATIIFKAPEKKNIIQFRDNTIKLPKGYLKIQVAAFKKTLDTLQNKPKTKQFALSELEKIEKKKIDFEIFVDEKNIENYVFVYACDFFQFDEQRAAEHVSGLSDQYKAASKREKIYYRRIQGRYFYTPKSKVVKLKFMRAFKKERRYQTEYIVASKHGGIGLSVSNTENIDFEDSIKNSLVAN